jgi:hypothetical protein
VLANTKQHAILWKTGIRTSDWGSARFVLEVQGLRENVPYLEVGDLIIMREISQVQKTGTGRAFESRILRLQRREGLVRV